MRASITHKTGCPPISEKEPALFTMPVFTASVAASLSGAFTYPPG
jgi:hypothetical protein